LTLFYPSPHRSHPQAPLSFEFAPVFFREREIQTERKERQKEKDFFEREKRRTIREQDSQREKERRENSREERGEGWEKRNVTVVCVCGKECHGVFVIV